MRAQRTVQALAEHALRTFRAHDLIIHAVDGHIAGWDWNAINASRELHDFFKGLMRNANDINTIFVIGPTGREGNSSLVFPLAPTDMTGRPFYEDLRSKAGFTSASPTSAASTSSATSASPDAGRQPMALRRRHLRFRQPGVLRGLLQHRGGESDRLGLARALRRAAAGSGAGAPPAGERSPAAHAGQPDGGDRGASQAGTFSQRGSVDGIERIYSYRRVGDYPLYATYGLSYDTVWAAWKRNMLAYGLVCLTAIGLLIAAAALVRRHDRREAEAASRYLEETARRMAAEQTNRSKDEFLATLGHELRNPLSSISASAEILRRANFSDVNAAGAVNIIGRQVEHLRRLLNDLLDVARSIYGKMNLEPQIVSLLDVASSVAATYPGAIRREVSIKVGGVRAWARADPTRLRQMIEKLVDNAQKYGATPRRPAGHGERRLGRAERRRRWRRHPRGSAAHDVRALRPGQAGARSVGGRAGTGTRAVSAPRRRARRHVARASDGPGKGSTFTLRLPKSPPPDPARSRAGTARRHDRSRVLVVEDQQDARDSLRMLLELDDHLVDAASSGHEGVAKFDAFRPDVVLVDIGLPDMNGYEVARAIRSRASGNGVRLIALTGYGQPDDQRSSREAGFDHHLTKPVDYDKLRELLERPGLTSTEPPRSEPWPGRRTGT